MSSRNSVTPNDFALKEMESFRRYSHFAAKGLLLDKKGHETQRIIFSFAFYLGRLEKCATEPLWNAGAQWVNTSVMSMLSSATVFVGKSAPNVGINTGNRQITQ